LKIAISTNGKSPTAAKRIKQVLNESLPEEIDDVLENLNQFRNTIKGDFQEKVKRMNEITKPLVESDVARTERKWKRVATYFLAAFAFMLIGHFIFSYIPFKQIGTDALTWLNTLDRSLIWVVLAGFLAQMVDGALGMGYLKLEM
jgi:hypothetical protein